MARKQAGLATAKQRLSEIERKRTEADGAMTFISDGRRTWDPDRGLELKRTGGGKDGVYNFELFGPSGPLYFFAEWNPYKIDLKLRENDPDNPNKDVVIEWIVNVDFCLLGFDRNATKQIIREAMKSFESRYGNETLRGCPVKSVVCKFEGKIA
jgi:hypothetical protein